ncbi:MAG: hypothetical protein GXC73_14970 [Chitinophagaceae bacterium]|nr:hypothetical protein [Chitinophagaceae bacterium]
MTSSFATAETACKVGVKQLNQRRMSEGPLQLTIFNTKLNTCMVAGFCQQPF